MENVDYRNLPEMLTPSVIFATAAHAASLVQEFGWMRAEVTERSMRFLNEDGRERMLAPACYLPEMVRQLERMDTKETRILAERIDNALACAL